MAGDGAVSSPLGEKEGDLAGGEAGAADQDLIEVGEHGGGA